MPFTRHHILPTLLAVAAATFTGSALSKDDSRSLKKETQGSVSGQWKPMDIVPFSAPAGFVYPEASPKNKDSAQKIWQKEISAMPMVNIAGKQSRQLSEVYIYNHEEGDISYTFSIMNGSFSNGCIPPGNGSGMVDEYSTCPLRVTALDRKTGNSAIQQFEDYCFIFINDKDRPFSKNHNEISIDASTGVAKFRIIQNGKIVPDCNKTLRYRKQ